MNKLPFNDGTSVVKFWGLTLSKPLLWVVFILAALALALIFFNSRIIYVVKKVVEAVISLFTKKPAAAVLTPAEDKKATSEFMARKMKSASSSGLKL